MTERKNAGKQIQHFLINEVEISADRVFLLDAKLTTHAQNGAVASGSTSQLNQCSRDFPGDGTSTIS